MISSPWNDPPQFWKHSFQANFTNKHNNIEISILPAATFNSSCIWSFPGTSVGLLTLPRCWQPLPPPETPSFHIRIPISLYLTLQKSVLCIIHKPALCPSLNSLLHFLFHHLRWCFSPFWSDLMSYERQSHIPCWHCFWNSYVHSPDSTCYLGLLTWVSHMRLMS